MADSSLRCAIQKLNGENYSIWSYKMELMLIEENLWDVITEDKPAESEVTKYATWKKSNDKARARIGLLVEDDQLLHIRKAKTAKEAWSSLKEYHQKSTLTSKVLLLKRICRTVLDEGGDMEAHISNFSNHINQLSALGQDLPDNLTAALLLGSLPESYDTLVTALESRPETDITTQFIKSKLIDEYKRRQGIKNIREGTHGSETVMQSVYNRNKDTNTQKGKNCFFCKRQGHLKQDCLKYKAWKIKREKQEKANKVTDEDISRESFFLVTNTSEEEPIYTEHISTCLSSTSKEDKHIWFVDSGATSHMTNSIDFFTKLDRNATGYVQLAEVNKRSEVRGRGSGIIKCLVDGHETELKLENVLYIPTFGSNLISVKSLTKAGYRVSFLENNCKIEKDGRTQAMATVGSLVEELYKLQMVNEKVYAAINDPKHNVNCQHTWHRRFGHRDIKAINDLVNKDLATGISIKDCGRREECECCLQGKMTRPPFPKESSSKTKNVLDLLHTDVCGPMQTMTLGKKKYLMTVIDDYSRYTEVYFLKTKDEATTYIKQFVEMVKTQYNKIPKCIRSDRGKEYVNKELQDYLKGRGIKVQYTAAYSPQQNGVAERKNRSLMEMARCMLLDANLSKVYWAEAVNTANFIQNRLPTKATNKTPYELWNKKKPDVRHLHVFGCEAYVQIPREHRKKLDDKAEKMIFLGYSEESKAFRFLNRKTDKLIISRDVVFLENNTNLDKSLEDKEEEYFFGKNETSGSESNTDQIKPTTEVNNAITSSCTEDKRESSTLRKMERKNRGVPPDRYMATSKLVMEDPKSRKEALLRPEKEEWQRAMDEEINSLLQNDTWDIVAMPEDENIVSCKWVFKTKINLEGKIDRYKARLVARGFSQKFGIDYDAVFAPVVKQTTFKLLLTIAGNMNLTIKHFDAKTAFLNGDLQETIYMMQPEGYNSTNRDGTPMVCKLKKGLYGLKQAAKIWNDKLHSTLKEFDFVETEADPCFYKKSIKNGTLYLIVHVDDFLIAAKRMEDIDETAAFLKKKFRLADLGLLKKYLGIEVRKNQEGIYCIKQSQYIDDVLKKFGLQDSKTSYIPLDTGYLKNRKDEPPMDNNERYQQLVGALLYLSVNTRPDITASVNIMSQHNKQPSLVDWNELKRITRYLKGTRDYELILGHKIIKGGLIGYADADWAENRENRKSNSGYVFQYMSATISWACRKQTCVALSSTEAEYIALAEACQEGLWIRRLVKDFTGEDPEIITMYEDNQSCLKLIDNRKSNHRTKHIDTKYHFIRDLQEKGIMKFEYCPTADMVADMLTKPLNKNKLKYLAERTGLF